MTIGPHENEQDEPGLAAAEKDLREIRARDADRTDPPASELNPEQLKQLLLMESSAPDAALRRPYLEAIPGKYAAEITLFEWLDFLLGRVGVRETLSTVAYYEELGWLGADAAAELRDHVRAFEDTGAPEREELDMADHVRSLVFIARLSSMAR